MLIKAIRYRSFYLAEELVSKYVVVFFKIDEKWFEFVVSEGSLTVKIVAEPQLIATSEINDEFKFPISEITDPVFQASIFGKSIDSIFKLVLQNDEDVTVGVKILLENNSYIFFYENIKLESCSLTFNKENVKEDIIYIRKKLEDIAF